MSDLCVHEETYKRKSVEGAIHRNRLEQIEKIFHSIEIKQQGTLGDFGCSNGYVIQHLQEVIFKGKDWHYVGLDHSQELLDMAIAKQIPNTDFQFVDLNVPNPELVGKFDIVTCFETLEHVGSLPAAVANLYDSCKPGGYIIIGVPNEKGLPGLVKYLGRRTLRKNAYEDFFDNHSELKYFMYLLLNKRIDGFRTPPQPGWGPHLGFDVSVLQQQMYRDYVDTGKAKLLLRWKTKWGFNILYALHKKA